MATLPRRPLGRSGISIAPFALGGNVFGWTVDEKTGFGILDAFVDAGFNLIDTADVYSRWVPGHEGGESESMIGRWLHERGRRKEVALATKVGMDMGPKGIGLSPDHIRSSIEGSLARLQTDHVDLYQAHIDDPDTPLDQTLAAFGSLVESGKVRAIGASNYEAPRLEQALAVSKERGLPRFESLQPRYNLMDRNDFESSLERVCREHELGVIGFSSLASGFLSGKYRTKADLGKSPRGRRMEARMTERGFRILAALDEVSGRLGSTPATVALAWLISRPSLTAPIASATSLAQLDSLIQAVTLRIDRDSLEQLDNASALPHATA